MTRDPDRAAAPEPARAAPLESSLEPALEPERYELHAAPDWRFDLDRREFLQVLGAGLLLAALPGSLLAQERGRRAAPTLGARLHLGADGTITVLCGKVEVGQGARTQVTLAAAEELGVAIDSVRVVLADSALVPDDGGTYGSRTTPSTVPAIRAACSAARQLRDAAARRLGRELSYAALAGLDDVDVATHEVASDVEVVRVAEWKVLGRATGSVAAHAIVTGAHRYPSDVVRPGMLYGAVLRPPSFGATLEAIELPAAESIPAVVAVRDGSFVGFAAPTSFAAREARELAAGTARWTPADPASCATNADLFEQLVATASDEGSGRGRGGPRQRGAPAEAMAGAARVLRERYLVAYVQHAPLEPRAAVAEWGEQGLTVWTGTQNPSRVRDELVQAFRLAPGQVRVIVPDTGGAFGGKHTGEAAVEAARLAKAAGRPVSLQWSREEEFTWAYFRPAGVVDVAAGLDGAGRIEAWEQCNTNSGSSGLETPYAVANVASTSRASRAPLRQGSYRALAATANTFARESFMDELAAALAVDPLEYRLRHLADERLRAVLEQAAARFEWSRRRRECEGDATRGVGLACGIEKGSYTAACVELAIDAAAGRFAVREICQAFECGAIHNPSNLRAQVEGCIVQGLGAALREEVRFAGGAIENPRFSRYLVPRFRDVPRLDTVLLDRPDLPSAGAGETPIIAVAPAIANALFAATRHRIRSLPIRDERFASA